MAVNKYRAKPTTVDGIRFDSGAEARRYAQLKLLARAGIVTDLELQPRFELRGTKGGLIGHFKADFRYRERGAVVIEDVKSPATARNTAYRLRVKLFLENYPGTDFREVCNA